MTDRADSEPLSTGPPSPESTEVAVLAEHLADLGVPAEAISSATTLRDASRLAWMHILGIDYRSMPIRDVAAELGTTEDGIVRIIRALGLADQTSELAVTAEDVELLRLMSDSASLFGEDQVMHLARVIGSSMARIAEALAASFRVAFEGPILREHSYADFIRSAGAAVDEPLRQLARLMDRVVRYHILAVGVRGAMIDVEASATTLPMAVGFADMVGFTARVGAGSIGDLAAIVDEFEGRVTDAVIDAGGRVVKLIGDEVMFVASDASQACACATRLVELGSTDAVWDVRVGLAFGDVLLRYGDHYGPVVNVASRLARIAEPGTVLVTPDLAHAAGEGFVFEEMTPRELKGIDEPVTHLRLRSA